MVSYLGPLVQLCCGGGRSTADKSDWRVGSARSGWAALGLPRSRMCAFPVYTAQSPGCSAGELSKAGPGLRALPRAKLLRFRLLGTPHGCKRGWACAMCPSQVRAAQATRCLVSAHSPLGRCISLPPGPSPSVSCVHGVSADSGVWCVSSGELISDCDPPGGCQPSRIPERLG